MSFLQAHYNRYRDMGGDHASYVVWNDIDDELAKDLRESYEFAAEKAEVE